VQTLGLLVALVLMHLIDDKIAWTVARRDLVPWAIPTIVSANMWAWMLNDPFGIVNDRLGTTRQRPQMAELLRAFLEGSNQYARIEDLAARQNDPGEVVFELDELRPEIVEPVDIIEGVSARRACKLRTIRIAGHKPARAEDVAWRKNLLRQFGYKL
jgi:hypothetical protein